MQDAKLAIIGGSGFYDLPGLENIRITHPSTPYGVVDELVQGELCGNPVVFLARHGSGHNLAPHQINYRANIWALHALGVEQVLAFNTVGGIGQECCPGTLVIPSQIIDYTYGREHTFVDAIGVQACHTDFTHPFDTEVRAAIIGVLKQHEGEWLSEGVYGCMQGPRLETAAEVKKLARDGCTLVGMTVMPEAALARELGLRYAAVSTVVNWAAGVKGQGISLADMKQVLEHNSHRLARLTAEFVLALIGRNSA